MLSLKIGTLGLLLLFFYNGFRSVESELPKITVDTLIDKLKQYVWSLELQENSSNETTLTPNIDENLQDLFQKLYDKLESMSGTWDPTNIDRADFTTDTPLIKFKGFVSPVKFSGMAQNTISKLNVTQHLDFELSIEFENFMGEGYYDLDFNILSVLPLYGAGDFSLIISGFSISVAINFQEGAESLHATSFMMDFKIDKITGAHCDKPVNTNLEGFIGGGKLGTFVNNVLSDVGADLIMQYKETLLDLLKPVLKFHMNQRLAEYKITIDYIVNLINKFLHGNITPT